jgi:hypothetical protein
LRLVVAARIDVAVVVVLRLRKFKDKDECRVRFGAIHRQDYLCS